MSAPFVISLYLLFQAAVTTAWWCLLWLVPESTSWFSPQDWPLDSLFAFSLSDGLLIIGGSTTCAVAIMQKRTWAPLAIWALTGAIWSSTLYCLGTSLITNQAWVATAMMTCMAGTTLAMATIHGTANQQPMMVRVMPMTIRAAICWTYAQTFIFWSVFLGILPQAILELERYLKVSSFSHLLQTPGSIFLFTIASLLGLWSGFAMATQGKGTPLPTATALTLVVSGPYRLIRNPMATAGILQGIAVGWFYGSYGIFLYAIAGALMWHIIVRPFEENELSIRFGNDYHQYKRLTSLWFPAISKIFR